MSSVPMIPAAAARRSEPSAGERLSSALAFLARTLLWPARVLRARAELAKLAELTDRDLRDIGLMRQDLRNATALPLDADPTRYLAQVVCERRSESLRAAACRRESPVNPCAKLA